MKRILLSFKRKTLISITISLILSAVFLHLLANVTLKSKHTQVISESALQCGTEHDNPNETEWIDGKFYLEMYKQHIWKNAIKWNIKHLKPDGYGYCPENPPDLGIFR